MDVLPEICFFAKLIVSIAFFELYICRDSNFLLYFENKNKQRI